MYYSSKLIKIIYNVHLEKCSFLQQNLMEKKLYTSITFFEVKRIDTYIGRGTQNPATTISGSCTSTELFYYIQTGYDDVLSKVSELTGFVS